MGLTTNQKIAVAIIIGAAVAVGIGLLIYQRSIHSSGVIASIGIEIYQDQDLTAPLEAIDWGTVKPGLQYGISCWITNTKTVNVTLALQTTNWQPAGAKDALSITWDYINGTVLQPQQKINVNIYLTVAEHPEPTTNFSNDIVITATEKE